MSEAVRKIYNAPIAGLDLQIVELVDAVSGKGTRSIVVRDPDTNDRYALIATRMRDEYGNIVIGEDGQPIPQLSMSKLV